jgi:hypothetical protein
LSSFALRLGCVFRPFACGRETRVHHGGADRGVLSLYGRVMRYGGRAERVRSG